MEVNSLFPLTPIPQTCPDEAALAALQKHVKKSTEDASSSKSKVLLRFQPVSGGNTPVLKQNVFKLAAGSPFQVVTRNLKKKLGMKEEDPLVRVFGCIILFNRMPPDSGDSNA